jgi:hypothetical protein
MAALTKQSVAFPSSVAPTYVAAAGGGDTCKAGDDTYLFVKNGGGSPITVTIPGYPTTAPWGGAVTGLVVTVANAAEKWIGPLKGAQFRNPATDNVEIAYSGVTSVTVACVSMP